MPGPIAIWPRRTVDQPRGRAPGVGRQPVRRRPGAGCRLPIDPPIPDRAPGPVDPATRPCWRAASDRCRRSDSSRSNVLPNPCLAERAALSGPGELVELAESVGRSGWPPGPAPIGRTGRQRRASLAGYSGAALGAPSARPAHRSATHRAFELQDTHQQHRQHKHHQPLSLAERKSGPAPRPVAACSERAASPSWACSNGVGIRRARSSIAVPRRSSSPNRASATRAAPSRLGGRTRLPTIPTTRPTARGQQQRFGIDQPGVDDTEPTPRQAQAQGQNRDLGASGGKPAPPSSQATDDAAPRAATALPDRRSSSGRRAHGALRSFQ